MMADREMYYQLDESLFRLMQQLEPYCTCSKDKLCKDHKEYGRIKKIVVKKLNYLDSKNLDNLDEAGLKI